MDNEKPTREPLELSKEDLEALFESTFYDAQKEGSKKDPNKHVNTPLFEGSFEGHQKQSFERSRNKNLKPGGESRGPKSSLRMKYEAEVSNIKKTHGDLEGIRRKLGLSKRKVAQLLLVDPSAWTRWTKKKGEAPPHIYRALQWYLLLQDKHPEYKSSLWLNAVATPSISEHEMENIKREVVNQARMQLDAMPTYLETESVDLGPLERRLRGSQKLVKTLEKRLRWLVVSQIILLGSIVILAIL